MAVPRVPRDVLHDVIDTRSDTYTRYRTSRTVQSDGTTDETQATTTVELYVTEEQNARQQLPHGESRGQSLSILALPTTDIVDGDEIDYGDNRWELTVTHVPNENSPDYLNVVAERADTS